MNTYEYRSLEQRPLEPPFFPLSPALSRTIDGAQARYLRRILKVPAAYISRVSHRSLCRQ